MKIKSKSFIFNLFSHYLYFIIFFACITLLLSYQIVNKKHVSYLVLNLKSEIETFNYWIKPQLTRENRDLQLIITDLARDKNRHITIFNARAQIIADSKQADIPGESYADYQEVREAINKGVGKNIRFDARHNTNHLSVAMPIKANQTLLGITRITLCINDYSKMLNEQFILLVLVILGMVLMAGIYTYFYSKKITRPIKLLSEVSKEVAIGNFKDLQSIDEPIDNSEVYTLAENFNAMIKQLSFLFKELKTEKEELNLIISSINEGIIVIDDKGQILKNNDSFLQLFKHKYVTGRYYWEIIRNSKIMNSIKKINSKNRSLIKEIEFQEKILLCSINYLPNHKGCILGFHDITELKKLEMIKREFVSNVSHELRTPLTSIKGFIETLIEDETDHHKLHYLNIIQKNNERLINLVKDLLMLSQFEKYKFKLDISSFNLEKMLNNILVMFERKASEKNITIHYKIDPDCLEIEGDSFKLEQMFFNLIDNSIKYTDQGRVSIKVRQTRAAEYIRIRIKDTGIGIARHDQNRIFERFYVVDQSRSKKSGGTGLGLSIVKHVVLSHKGKIYVSSLPGKGTTITIYLPVIFSKNR